MRRQQSKITRAVDFARLPEIALKHCQFGRAFYNVKKISFFGRVITELDSQIVGSRTQIKIRYDEFYYISRKLSEIGAHLITEKRHDAVFIIVIKGNPDKQFIKIGKTVILQVEPYF